MARAVHSEAEEFQIFAGRIRPIYHTLFNTAHAVTDNCEQAEYALQSAMLDAWSAGDAAASRHGFREGMRERVLRAALRAGEGGEADWKGFAASVDNADLLACAVLQENTDIQRLLALHYGCSLSPRRISRLTGQDMRRIRSILRRFDARTRRKLSERERRRYDVLISRTVKNLLFQPTAQAPEMSSVLRTFQADAAEVAPSSHLPLRIIRSVVLAIVALVCIFAFWLIAVLIQPAVLEVPTAAETAIVKTDAN